MLAPRSIAIVGASPRAASFGVRTLENLANFKGGVYPVNAKYKEVGGRPCFPSLSALPEKPATKRRTKAKQEPEPEPAESAEEPASFPAANNDTAAESAGEPRRGWWQRTFG